MPIRTAFAIAAVSCLLVAPAAHAAGHAVTLGDARETTCASAPCAPDLASLAVYYDDDGTFYFSATFYDALPAYDPLTAARLRINLGGGLAAGGQDCAPVGASSQLTGAAGDVRVETGAFTGGSSPASGALFVTGTPGSSATTRAISSDSKTLTLTATSASLAGLQLHCVQADLVDDATLAIRDQVQLAWFPGFGPPPPATSPPAGAPGSTSASTPTATATATGAASPLRPSLLAAPGVRGVRKVARVLTCGTGRWLHAARLAYRWLRGGHPIAGAAARRYRIRAADRGHRVRCRVTARNPAGSRVAVTKPVRIP